MKAFSYLATSILAVVAAPAQAAFMISLDDVPATGTLRTDFICSDPSTCPTTFDPYETLVNGNLSPQITTLNGIFSFNGQDRPRSAYNVNLLFSGGALISSSLTGVWFPLPGIANPNITITFAATNFSVNVTDTTTGVTRILAPVPEPATWAMMLVGFCAVGAAMRKFRSSRRGTAQLA